MAIDATGLEDWPKPDTIDTAADALATKGKQVRGKVEDCETAWKTLYPGFQTDHAAVQEKVEKMFDLITTHGDAVEGATYLVKDAVTGFASKVRELELRRTEAHVRIGEHDRLEGEGDLPDGGIYTTDAVQTYINNVVGDLVLAAEDCGSKLEGIDGQAISDAGFVAPSPGASDAVTVAGWAQFSRVDYTYTVLENVEIPVWDYTTTAPSADWVIDSNGVVSRAPFINGPEVVDSRVEVQEVEHTGTKKSWTGMRTPVNPWAYEHFDWYKERVDAHAERYTTAGPRMWDLKGRLLDFEDAMRNGGNFTRVLRVAGPIAMVAGAGLTYKSEYDKALEEVAAEHPDWTEEEIRNRAGEMSAVQGTTQIGLDLAAGMAGAAIGTAIGGPFGTVVGFGAGIFISWVANESGINDWVKEKTQELWDWGTDELEPATDAIGDAWNWAFG